MCVFVALYKRRRTERRNRSSEKKRKEHKRTIESNYVRTATEGG